MPSHANLAFSLFLVFWFFLLASRLFCSVPVLFCSVLHSFTFLSSLPCEFSWVRLVVKSTGLLPDA